MGATFIFCMKHFVCCLFVPPQLLSTCLGVEEEVLRHRNPFAEKSYIMQNSQKAL